MDPGLWENCSAFSEPAFSSSIEWLCMPQKITVRTNVKCFSSVQFSSVAQSCPTLCDLMNRSTPGLPGDSHMVTAAMKLKDAYSLEEKL